jgi:hypothetical protein
MRPVTKQLSAPALFLICAAAMAQTAPVSGRRYAKLAIRNAMVVDGNGTPASGPYDIIIENNRIATVVALDPVALNRGAHRLPARCRNRGPEGSTFFPA